MATNYIERPKNPCRKRSGSRWSKSEFETLSRLYMPLQEARRQRRQRCGEGNRLLRFDLLKVLAIQIPVQRVLGEVFFRPASSSPAGPAFNPHWKYAGFSRSSTCNVETFLAAVYPTTEARIIAIAPENSPLASSRSASARIAPAAPPPAHAFLFAATASQGVLARALYQTYSQVMSMWESLHAPFLAAADAEPDPIKKNHAYRRTIGVDYACEFGPSKTIPPSPRVWPADRYRTHLARAHAILLLLE